MPVWAVLNKKWISIPLNYKEIYMTFDEVIVELYRLAETKKWDGGKTDEALVVAIEGMEQIWSLRQADQRRNSRSSAARKQPRIWS